MAKRLAVINDDPLFLALMDALLAREGYDVAYYASSGAKAYEPLRERAPDAILLDLRMERPDASLKALELFKLDPVLSTTPIIVCSADLVQVRAQEAYLKSKGCVVLRKPFELSDLLTCSRWWVAPGDDGTAGGAGRGAARRPAAGRLVIRTVHHRSPLFAACPLRR